MGEFNDCANSWTGKHIWGLISGIAGWITAPVRCNMGDGSGGGSGHRARERSRK